MGLSSVPVAAVSQPLQFSPPANLPPFSHNAFTNQHHSHSHPSAGGHHHQLPHHHYSRPAIADRHAQQITFGSESGSGTGAPWHSTPFSSRGGMVLGGVGSPYHVYGDQYPHPASEKSQMQGKKTLNITSRSHIL